MARKVQSRKIKLSPNVELNAEVVQKLIERHMDEKRRIEKMMDYYDGRTDIKDRVYAKPNRPTNRISNPTASYLSSMLVGYTFGKGVTYKSENPELLEIMTDVLAYNDVADLDQALADNATICGYGVELQYIDEDGIPRLKAIPSNEVILVHDNTIEENLLYAIRYWDEEDILVQGQVTTYAEVYTKECVKYFQGSNNVLNYVDEVPHLYGDVPVTVYPMNNNWFGCYEKVIDNIDSYDQVKSDVANLMESNASKAILVISGLAMEDDDESDVGTEALEADVINFSEPTSSATFLTKDIDITAIEAYLDRLMNDIHTFSQIPPLDSEGFVASASGESLKWKCLGLEILASNFEAKFRKAIARRMELLCKILAIKHNRDYDFTDIEPVFTRNTPANLTEATNIVKSLYGIISDETLLSLLPFITDVQQEMAKIEEAKEDNLEVDYNLTSDIATDKGDDDEEI